MLHKSAAVYYIITVYCRENDSNSYQTCESDGELLTLTAEQQETVSLSPKQEVEVHFHSIVVTLSALIVALCNKEAWRAAQTDCTHSLRNTQEVSRLWMVHIIFRLVKNLQVRT